MCNAITQNVYIGCVLNMGLFLAVAELVRSLRTANIRKMDILRLEFYKFHFQSTHLNLHLIYV